MSILDEIFANKRREVEASKDRVPESDLRARALDMAPFRGFRRALITDPRPISLIAEVKRASPSEGVIRQDFNPVEIAHTYEREGAACLSVLTDETHFGGSPEYLGQIRAEVGLPLLRKDFLFDPYQLWEAVAWGADAVLLIVAYWGKPIEGPSLKEMHDHARDLGLDVLVEVHNEEETDAALTIGADLIGVNNRDLATFQTDLALSERLVPRIVPHAVAVSESALSKPDDVARVRAAGARAVLVGTTFCRAPDVGKAVRQLMGE